MVPRSLCPCLVLAWLGILPGAALACATRSAAPAGDEARLAIVPTPSGFWIEPPAKPGVPCVKTARPVRLGMTMVLDARLFERAEPLFREVSHAPRR